MGRSTLKKTGWVGPRRLQIKMEALYFLACIASLWQGVTSFVPETVPTAKIAEPGTAKCRHWRVEFSPRFLDTCARHRPTHHFLSNSAPTAAASLAWPGPGLSQASAWRKHGLGLA